MMIVQAIAMGADIATFPREGRVVAVFARACAIALNDGRRLTVIGGDRDRGMRMMVLSDPDWAKIHDRIEVGQHVVIGKQHCDLAGMRLTWAENTIWQTPKMPNQVPETAWQPSLDQAAAILETLRQPHRESLMWRAAHERFAVLCDAVEKGQPVEEAIINLIGAGPGLTPSGDDLLSGFMAGLAAGGDERFSAVRNTVLAHMGSTTATSRDYLEQAANGWWTAGLYRLFAAIETASDVAGACINLVDYGHSSGIDLATGLIAGLHFAAGQPLRPVSTSL